MEGVLSAIEIKEVQARIAEMLAAVERGDSVSITRNGNAIATLEPVLPTIVIQGGKRLPDLSEFRASLKVNNLGNSVDDLRSQERY